MLFKFQNNFDKHKCFQFKTKSYDLLVSWSADFGVVIVNQNLQIFLL